MKSPLRHPYDIIVWVIIAATLLTVYSAGIYASGFASGTRAEREQAWAACTKRYDRTTLVRVNDPCR